MSDVPSENDRQDIPTDKRKQTVTISRIVIAAVTLFAILILIDWKFVNEHSERVRFITVNSLSLCVVVIIAIQAVIYRREWRVMQQGLRQTDRMIDKMHEQLESTRKLVAQNERAVKAAEDNVETVEKSAVYANRAYVTATIERMGENFTFHLRIENRGNTPANDVRVSYTCKMLDKAPIEKTEDGQTLYNGGCDHFKALGLIAPNSNAVLITPKGPVLTHATLATPELRGWKAGQLRFYVWGSIIYEDIFNQGRVTWFCFVSSHAEANGYPYEHGNYAI